jgi:hypothetical protein
MRKVKLSTEELRAYDKMREYWDKHNLTEIWDKTRDVDVDVKIESEVTLYEIERSLSEKLQQEAKKRGVSSGTLANLWLQQRLQEESAPKRMKSSRRAQVA